MPHTTRTTHVLPPQHVRAQWHSSSTMDTWSSEASTPRQRLSTLQRIPPQPAPLSPLVDIDSLRPVPLRDVVHRLLEEWDIESISSEDDDDFCGWRVGSRALPVPGQPAPPRSTRHAPLPTAAAQTPRPSITAGIASLLSGGDRGSIHSSGGGRPPGKCTIA